MESGEEGPSPYFGDYPDGAYFSAVPIPGARERHGPPPWVRAEPRTPEDPYPLRMFAEDSCEFALWGPVDEPPPGVAWDDEYEYLEDVLPISADLRRRLMEWARQHMLLGPDPAVVELDWAGFHLSRELAAALGELYSVEYSAGMAGPHQAEMRTRADEAPQAGWRFRRPGE